jgi:hypothetical protein
VTYTDWRAVTFVGSDDTYPILKTVASFENRYEAQDWITGHEKYVNPTDGEVSKIVLAPPYGTVDAVLEWVTYCTSCGANPNQ